MENAQIIQQKLFYLSKSSNFAADLSPVGGKYYGSPPQKGGLFFLLCQLYFAK